MEAEVERLEQGLKLEAVAVEHRQWLVRRLALVVGDVTEAEDLAQQALLRGRNGGRFRPAPTSGHGSPLSAPASRSTSGDATVAGASCQSARQTRSGR